MDESFFRKPIPAVVIAVGVVVAAGKANANAARAIGIPAVLFGLLLSLVLARFGFSG